MSGAEAETPELDPAGAALEGLRVLELGTGPVGGFASVVLADFGADVIKVEPPGGDRFRSLASAPLWLRGKRSVELDLRTADGRARLASLIAGSDVAIASAPPARALRLGIDRETLSTANPDLIHCAITGWGPRGPYADDPGYEGLVAARSGRMQSYEGLRARPGPAFAAVPVASHAAAQGAVQGVLAALVERERTGVASPVETSLLQGLLPYDLAGLLLVELAERGIGGVDPSAMGGGMPTLNYHPVQTSDGRWIQLGNLLEHLFFAFLDAIDLLPELLADPRFEGSPAGWTGDVLEEARDRILTRMRERTCDEWMKIFRENGNVAAEPYATTREALDHPDLISNGDIVEHVHPDLGAIRQIGPIAHLARTPGRAGGPAPAVGAHTRELLDAPAVPPTAPARRARSEPVPGRPLHGITVLEVATIIAAPLATSLLADLGARVIKIEPIGGDPYRHLLPDGVLAVKTNAGKESLCVDLKADAGRAIVRALIERADVLVHNFRPGVPDRLGFGYDAARAVRPDLVWVSANGYGPDCPSARRPAAHPVPGAAMGGAGYQAGAGMPPTTCSSLEEVREASRQLMRANDPCPDPNTSVVIASAALLALWVRERRGVGQAVYVNMFTANAWANGDDFLTYSGKAQRRPVDADLLGLGAGYRLYPTREGWVFLAVGSERDWSELASALEIPELGPGGPLGDAPARDAAASDVATRLERAFARQSADEWEKQLLARGVGCVRADGRMPGSFFAKDEHALANGLAPRTEHARFGDVRRWGPLVTCGGGSDRYGAGALAGDHTDPILGELGYDAEAIRELRSSGVVASEPVDPYPRGGSSE